MWKIIRLSLLLLCLSLVLSVNIIFAELLKGKITFLSCDENLDQGMYIMNADGSDITRLAEGVSPAFSLSPDCKKIIFAMINWVTDISDIAVFDIDSHSLVNLTNGKPRKCFEPRWSPDGRKIVFSNYNIVNASVQICVMNADGTNVKVIGKGGFSPDWSPDGQRIACWVRQNGDIGDIYIMDINGDKRQNVTNGQFVNEISFLRWSPDSKQILFCCNGNIYSIDSNGNNLKKLIGSTKMRCITCCWSPGGQRIAFDAQIEPGGQYNIWVMDINGNNLKRLTDSDKEEFSIDWRDPSSVAVQPLKTIQTTWAWIKQGR
jgi:Tol biopolymer transport system component